VRDFTKVDLGALWEKMIPQLRPSFNKGAIGNLFLIGIRAALEPSPAKNLMAEYDDIILRFVDNEVTQWVASTDPSWTLVANPIHTVKFAAQLKKGIHLFEPVWMHGKYHCLGQAEDVHIERLNRDGTVNHEESGQFGICIHSGGAGRDTGRFSAGCQIIQNPDGYFGDPTWTKFWAPILSGMSRHALTTVPYLLCDIGDLP
jgi:hypothetical protein